MDENDLMDVEFNHGKIKDIGLKHELEGSFLSYAMSVIVARAIPDVRDGLKPVQRRILWGMNELNLTPGVAHKKSARIVGDVMGKYHPHGDSSIYEAMVHMAQDFSYRYPLVDGHGNFGNVDGDGAAAMRYTEARMSKMAMEMLRDINKETVPFVDNYDASELEPEILPARVPNLLINGTTGIAVGMATNIPPHNLGEVIDGTLALIDNPELDSLDLMNYIKGPDFPTGGIILGANGLTSVFVVKFGVKLGCRRLFLRLHLLFDLLVGHVGRVLRRSRARLLRVLSGSFRPGGDLLRRQDRMFQAFHQRDCERAALMDLILGGILPNCVVIPVRQAPSGTGQTKPDRRAADVLHQQHTLPCFPFRRDLVEDVDRLGKPLVDEHQRHAAVGQLRNLACERFELRLVFLHQYTFRVGDRDGPLRDLERRRYLAHGVIVPRRERSGDEQDNDAAHETAHAREAHGGFRRRGEDGLIFLDGVDCFFCRSGGIGSRLFGHDV